MSNQPKKYPAAEELIREVRGGIKPGSIEECFQDWANKTPKDATPHEIRIAALGAIQTTLKKHGIDMSFTHTSLPNLRIDPEQAPPQAYHVRLKSGIKQNCITAENTSLIGLAGTELEVRSAEPGAFKHLLDIGQRTQITQDTKNVLLELAFERENVNAVAREVRNGKPPLSDRDAAIASADFDITTKPARNVIPNIFSKATRVEFRTPQNSSPKTHIVKIAERAIDMIRSKDPNIADKLQHSIFGDKQPSDHYVHCRSNPTAGHSGMSKHPT